MLTERQQREREERKREHRRLRCTKCGDRMRDYEPYTQQGEFVHARNGCANAGKTFDWDTPEGRRTGVTGKTSAGIVREVPKSYARARRRGARLASKHRPR